MKKTLTLLAVLVAYGCSSPPSFESFPKIDAHFHLNTANPAFDGIFKLINAEGKTVVGHLGEPRNCWLPLEAMTVPGDKSYFAEHPQYHMYLHPDYPTYEQQIAARDRRLAEHPGLRFVGAHLGSLEWDVDELAKRLDAHPNFAVDMAARICHFQIQDRQKVRRFILRYQDRLLYGTDLSVGDGGHDFSAIIATWQSDWRYFTTDKIMNSPAVPRPFKGLALPASVLKRIYYRNAVRWLGVWKAEAEPAAAPPSPAEAEAATQLQPANPPSRNVDEPFTFAVVGDSRGGGWLGAFRGTNVDRTRPLIIDKIAESNPAFVINAGDIVKQGEDRKQWREFELENKVFKDKNILYCPVLGNHEYTGDQEKALAGYFECFPALNNQPWYTLTYANCGLIMLDSNFSKQSKEQVESQKKWLAETLSKYQADDAIAFVFVFLHHSPYTNTRVQKPDRRVQEDFVPLLKACPKVKFVFSGHVHTYERFKIDGINYVVTGGGGAPLETLPPAGRSRYQDEYDKTGTKPRGTHFCLVTVGRDSIELKTLNLDPVKLTWSVGDDYREVYSPK